MISRMHNAAILCYHHRQKHCQYSWYAYVIAKHVNNQTMALVSNANTCVNLNPCQPWKLKYKYTLWMFDIELRDCLGTCAPKYAWYMEPTSNLRAISSDLSGFFFFKRHTDVFKWISLGILFIFSLFLIRTTTIRMPF